MPHHHYRRDDNEEEFIEAWTRLGCIWKPQAPGAGFDGVLICARTGPLIVEIKRIAEGRRKWCLTPTEQKTREQVESLGVRYNIITNLDEALALIGLSRTT